MSEMLLVRPENRSPKPKQALTVLVIDNVPESRALLKAALRSINAVEEVREASTTTHIGELLARDNVDIVLIEQNLDSENVFELIKTIECSKDNR